jgi:hypothetical protein
VLMGTPAVLVAVAAVPMPIVMLRIPSWCQDPHVSLTIKDAAGGTVKRLAGVPGTYLPIQLTNGQTVTTDFRMSLRVSIYNGTGAPADPSACNARSVVRAAVEWGPTLLAATRATDPRCAHAQPAAGPWAPAVSIIGVDPRVTPASEWLLPAGHDSNGDPIFAVVGTMGCVLFKSYYSIQNETFSVYPNFVTTSGLDQRGACAVTREDAHPTETSTVCLVCPAGERISRVVDAQFGELAGDCTAGITPKRCVANATTVSQVVAQYCLGTKGCSVPVDASLYGSGPCPGGAVRSLAVTVACAPEQCDAAKENWPRESTAVRLGCPANHTISEVLFAEFGILAGNCSSGFRVPGCSANGTLVHQVVHRQCVGSQTCEVSADTKLFPSTCGGSKTLAVKVACSA